MSAPATPPAAMPYVPPPPAPDALVRWPETFGRRYTIFVDTEEEFDWSAPLRRDAVHTTAIAGLTAADRRFADHGILLTYLVDYPIASDPAAVEMLRGLVQNGAAIGTQLHAWVNPPLDEVLTPANSFPGNLPRALEAAKLDRLTAVITQAFGTAPLAYRAGRYGIGPATLELIAERGYLIDSSVRSGYDYADEGGPDYSAIGNEAYRAGPGGAIVELPLTTVHTGLLRGRGVGLHRMLGRVPRGRGLFSRLGLYSRVALTPEDMPLSDALEAIAVAAGEGTRLLNFSFHSPSVVPGHTPYVRDDADLRAFYQWWDRVLADLAGRGYAPASLAELIAAAG